MSEDRRVQRTRGLLQRALLELLETRSYDSLTMQDVADRANVGRTTVYLHYESKDDLYRQAHLAEVARIAGAPLTQEELLADDPPARMVAAYAYHWTTRDLLREVYFARDAGTIHRGLRDHQVETLAGHLKTVFPDVRFLVPADVLAVHLTIAEMGLMQWWIEKHPPYTPEQMAAHFHRLRRGMLRAGLALDHAAE